VRKTRSGMSPVRLHLRSFPSKKLLEYRNMHYEKFLNDPENDNAQEMCVKIDRILEKRGIDGATGTPIVEEK
jgi:hypothetical protein